MDWKDDGNAEEAIIDHSSPPLPVHDAAKEKGKERAVESPQ
jgi:hypothetical protein